MALPAFTSWSLALRSWTSRPEDYQSVERCVSPSSVSPILPIEPAILEIVESYIRYKLMPADPGGDAMHLALASYHKCDFLVTWNCRHLANANKFGHIRRVNTMLGLFVPALVTPLELLGGRDETNDE